MEQLTELKLEKHTHVFYKNAEDSDDESKEIVLITITVPDEILNEEAEKAEIETTLSFSFTNVFVKANFKDKMSHCFNKFDADEKLTVVEDYLGTQIDFEYYMMTGIIDQHFPLHKKNEIEEIQECFAKYKNKLIRAFLFGGFEKYMQPMNMIKNYYGEKYAFEYCFLLHYIAWLTVPAILSIIVLVRMVFIFLNTKNVA